MNKRFGDEQVIITSNENYGSFLVPVIISKFSNEIKSIITREPDKDTWNAKIILQSLLKEIEAREKLLLTKTADENFNEDLPKTMSKEIVLFVLEKTNIKIEISLSTPRKEKNE